MSKPESIHGECYCGTVKFSAALPSKFCGHCHCTNCRRTHGAAFVTWIGFQKEQFSLTAGEEYLARFKTSTKATRTFCKVCGSTLFFESPRWAGEIHLTLANIKGTADRAPQTHVFYDDRARWVEISDNLKRYGGKTGTEPLD